MTKQRHLVIDCAICRSPLLIKYAVRIPRLDAHGALTPEIAAYVCHRSACFMRARWETLPKTSPATKEAL